MTQPRVARQGDLFARFGVPLPPIVDALPTELPQLEVRTQHTDQLFRLADDSILHLEFQTTQRPGDLTRFAAYNLAVFQQHGHPVFTVVLYGAGIHSAPDSLEAGSLTFRVRNILVGQEDGDAVLRGLQEKAAHGEPFTAADRVDLILSPLMRQSRPTADALRAAVPLVNRLPESQQPETIGALLGLVYHYLDAGIVQAILEDLSMANPLQELIDRREAQAERRALRTFLQARFGTLPDDVEQRIAAADLDQLDELIARAAIVERPDQL